MKRILIAVDESEQAEQAFDFYVNEVHKPTNKVFVLHCAELKQVSHHLSTSKGESPNYEEWQWQAAEYQENWAALQRKYEEKLAKHKIKGEFILTLTSRAGEMIVQTCREKMIDVIVMGSRGQGVLGRLLVGTVSGFVLHHSHVPVVIHRSKHNAVKQH